MAAASIAYSVQSPLNVLATLSAVAIAWENSTACMFCRTHRSTALALSQSEPPAGSPATAFIACPFTSGLSQLMKKLLPRNSMPGAGSAFAPAFGPCDAETCSSKDRAFSSSFLIS